jgi:hypothetical protein
MLRVQVKLRAHICNIYVKHTNAWIEKVVRLHTTDESDRSTQEGTMASQEEYDVVVVGGGAAGIAAALAAAQQGRKTVLIEAGPGVGGELVSGLPVDSCVNARGEWIAGGVATQLFDACAALGGYIGPVFDWRTMYAVCVDPELFRLAIISTLSKAGVTLRLYTSVVEVVTVADTVRGVITLAKGERKLIIGDAFVDCSGDGVLAVLAGSPFEKGGEKGELQPVSLVFRIGNVDFERYLNFVKDNPEEFTLGENPIIGKTPAECAVEAYRSGLPHVALSSTGSLLGGAIESGEMFPSTFVFTWPTSLARREVGLNTTRVAGIDATNAAELSAVLTTLSEQVLTCLRFCKTRLPGFEDSYLSSVASHVGTRETRRIMGEYVLTVDDVVHGRKREDGIAKGSHHVDVHGAGVDQLRIPIDNGGSYDIPFATLIPLGLANVLIAGRCISSTREANGSARVMGVCLSTGQAAGVAAAEVSRLSLKDVRDIDVVELRDRLRSVGAVLEGTA